MLVVSAMTGEEGYGGVVVREDLDGRGRLAPGGDWVDGADVLEAGHLGEAGTAYHGDVDGPVESFWYGTHSDDRVETERSTKLVDAGETE